MKNLSIYLNIVLFIAVVVLYILRWQDQSNQNTSPALSSTNAATTVYVNGDSLLNNYEYFIDAKKDFEAKTKQVENVIMAKRGVLEKEIGAYQQSAAGMSTEQRAGVEESLMKKQEAFKQYSENASANLQDEQAKFNEALFDKVAAYLKEFSKDKKYKIVMNYAKGTGILFANDSLDITQDVLKGLNKAYKK
jgi:outer membrane protein